jgi:hypothetical protein
MEKRVTTAEEGRKKMAVNVENVEKLEQKGENVSKWPNKMANEID